MDNNTNEGELIIQSPEITSTDSSVMYRSTLFSHDYSVRRRSTMYLALDPHFRNPIQEYVPSRPINSPFSVIRNNGPVSGIRGSLSPQQVACHNEVNTRRAFIVVGAIFVTSLFALFYIYMNFPELEADEVAHMKIPYDIEDAKKLGRVLDRYKDKYFFEVLSAVVVTYIFLQTFAIPGSISLSVLSGFLFSFPVALTLVCFCSATGASLCYIISYFVGRRIVYKYFPDKTKQWALTVNKHRGNLFNYLVFLRITPFLPNWFINVTSPIIGVPLVPFWIGTFIGVAPPSFVAIQTGQTLYNLSSSTGTWSWTSFTLLAGFAVLSLVPVLFQKRLKEAVE